MPGTRTADEELARAALEGACTAATWMLAQYDWKNVEALYGLVAQGVQLRQFPNEVLEALHRASGDVLTEQAAANPDDWAEAS